MGRIDTLLAAMTLEEKIGQLNMVASSRAVTGPGELGDMQRRDSLRADRQPAESLGRRRDARRPAPRGRRIPPRRSLAARPRRHPWPPHDISRSAGGSLPVRARPVGEDGARAAEEAAEDGVALTFAPMLDVARDPRWGRIVESPGEDTWVASQMAAAKTRGFQGHDLAAPDSLAATAKHLCAYGAVTAGREYASADVSERTLHEIYLPPFAAAVAAGAAAIMPAFIDVAGVPMTANAQAAARLAAGSLGFEGV